MLGAACGGNGAAAPGVASLGTSTTVASATGATASNAASDASPGGATGDPGEKAQKYASCMRTHGVPNFPSPTVSSHGNSVSIRVGGPGLDPNSPQFQAANAKCRSLLPGKGAAQQISAADQADYLKAAQCMRSHGITGFPDPVFPDGGVSFPIPRGMSTTSTQFDDARLICEKLIPAGLPYSS